MLISQTGVPAAHQSLQFQGDTVDDAKRTLASYGIDQNSLLVINDLRSQQAPSASSQDDDAEVAEMLRQRILGNAQMLNELRQVCDSKVVVLMTQKNPRLAEAASESRTRFLQTLQEQRGAMAQAELANSDPFDAEAQQKIEEAIRQEQVTENLHHALEYSPESFGHVTMLYVDLKVNGHPVKAFVDSGAQSTIISPECAERCG